MELLSITRLMLVWLLYLLFYQDCLLVCLLFRHYVHSCAPSLDSMRVMTLLYSIYYIFLKSAQAKHSKNAYLGDLLPTGK